MFNETLDFLKFIFIFVRNGLILKKFKVQALKFNHKTFVFFSDFNFEHIIKYLFWNFELSLL